MFLTKLPNGYYHIIYENESGKRTRITTKCKLKSEAHKFLLEFSSELRERKKRAHTFIDLKSFVYWFCFPLNMAYVSSYSGGRLYYDVGGFSRTRSYGSYK